MGHNDKYMKTEQEIKIEIARAEKELAEYKELLKKDPTNKDFKYDVDYGRHYIQHLKWVLK
jgi:hypothetical protein